MENVLQNPVNKAGSLRSQFWTMHTSMEGDHETGTDSRAPSHAEYRAIDADRPTNKELLGFMNTYVPDSSCHYGGSMPLSAMNQNTHVLVRSSNCWKTQGGVIPAHNPSFRQIDKILRNRCTGSESEGTDCNDSSP